MYIHTPHFLRPATRRRQPRCSRISALVNNAAANVGMQTSLQGTDFVPCRCAPSSGVAGSHARRLRSPFPEAPSYCSPSGCADSRPPQRQARGRVSPALADAYRRLSSRCERASRCGFDWRFPDGQCCSAPFPVLVACKRPSENCFCYIRTFRYVISILTCFKVFFYFSFDPLVVQESVIFHYL